MRQMPFGLLAEIYAAMILFILVFGLAIGSFLNVVIDRLNLSTIRGVLGGRSHCDHCKKTLGWYDLIPLLSFVVLGGKCRYCHSHISWQYPLVEGATGIVFGMWYVVWGMGGIWGLLYYLFISSALIVIFVSDLKYQIIPDQIVYPAIVLALIYNLFFYSLPTEVFWGYLLAGFGAAGFFWLLYFLTSKRGMGFGDVKLAALMGLFLGFPKIVVAFYFSFLTGALAGVILILAGKKKFGQTIPFGPFLVGGTLVAWFFGERILGYLG